MLATSSKIQKGKIDDASILQQISPFNFVFDDEMMDVSSK